MHARAAKRDADQQSLPGPVQVRAAETAAHHRGDRVRGHRCPAAEPDQKARTAGHRGCGESSGPVLAAVLRKDRGRDSAPGEGGRVSDADSDHRCELLRTRPKAETGPQLHLQQPRQVREVEPAAASCRDSPG